MEHGDLSSSISTPYQGQLEQLRTATNATVSHLNQTVSEVSEAAGQLAPSKSARRLNRFRLLLPSKRRRWTRRAPASLKWPPAFLKTPTTPKSPAAVQKRQQPKPTKAARAGEHGRGFAVVAAEVRKQTARGPGHTPHAAGHHAAPTTGNGAMPPPPFTKPNTMGSQFVPF